MITNSNDEQQQRVDEAGTSSQNQIVVPVANNSVVRVSESTSNDDWSSSTSDEGEGDYGRKQVATIRSPTETGYKIDNRFNECSNVTATVKNTNIYKDGVTVNQNVYCCPIAFDYVLKWCMTKRGIVISLGLLMAFLMILFLGLWLGNYMNAETRTTRLTSTTEKMSNNTKLTTITTLPTSTEQSSTESSTTSSESDEWNVITPEQWGAAPPNYGIPMLEQLPPAYVIFSETSTNNCTTTYECTKIVRYIQALHLKFGIRADVMYNFLIGGDGMVYEGRGWNVYSGVEDYDTEYFDDKSLSVTFIGRFNGDEPTEVSLQAAKNLLEFAVRTRKLIEDYKLKCLSQLSRTKTNPGVNLLAIIETWRGWDSRTIDDFPSMTTECCGSVIGSEVSLKKVYL